MQLFENSRITDMCTCYKSASHSLFNSSFMWRYNVYHLEGNDFSYSNNNGQSTNKTRLLPSFGDRQVSKFYLITYFCLVLSRHVHKHNQCSSLYEVYAVNTREPFRVFYYTIYGYLYFIRMVTSTYLHMVRLTYIIWLHLLYTNGYFCLFIYGNVYLTSYGYSYFIRMVTSTYLHMVTFTLQHMVTATVYEWLLLLIYIWYV